MNISPSRIKQLRSENGWTQEQLGEVAGISYRTIQRVEKDGSCSPESQMAIASAFGLSPDELSIEYKNNIGSGSLNIGGLIGISLCVFFITIQFYLAGDKALFFDKVSILLVVGLSFALSSMTSGFKVTLETFALIRWFIVEPNKEECAQRYLPIMRKLIIYLYSSGIVSTLIGLVAVITVQESSSYKMLLSVGVSFLTILYAAIIAEFIVRPLKNKVIYMLSV